MSEHALTAALDTLVERFDGERGDWADVLRRADVKPRPRRWPSRVRRVVAVAFAIAVLALVAMVSTGFGRDALNSLLERTHVDFWRSDPASQPVRWRFEDLAFGSPPFFTPQAVASQARTVGNLFIRGRQQTLFVAPTRRGGSCWMVGVNGIGRCLDPSPEDPLIISAGGGLVYNRHGFVRRDIDGFIFGEEIEHLAVEFANGESEDVDFVYVSEPIDAGFWAYSVSKETRTRKGRVRAIVARNTAGEVVDRLPLLGWPLPPSRQARSPGVYLGPMGSVSSGPSSKPRPPLQRGTANGVSFTVGKNGAVLIDLTRIEPDRRALLDLGTIYSCFNVLSRGGLTHVRGGGVASSVFGRGKRRVGLQISFPTPIDACEITAGYGQRWPGKLGYHSFIEMPFTEAGRRFFEDQAAARDVSFFTRLTELERLRRTSSPVSAEEVRKAFGSKVAALPSRDATPPKGKIGYWADGSGLLLRRVSSTGRRFEVVIGPKGGVISHNLKPYAITF